MKCAVVATDASINLIFLHTRIACIGMMVLPQTAKAFWLYCSLVARI